MSMLAGGSCTAVALVGTLYFAVVALGWLPSNLMEPFLRLIVGTIGISLAAGALWFGIRWLNSRDESGPGKPGNDSAALPKSD